MDDHRNPPPPPDRKASDPQLFMDRLNNNKFSEIMSIFSGLVLHARLIFLIKIFAKLRACIGTAQNCRVFRLASTLDTSIPQLYYEILLKAAIRSFEIGLIVQLTRIDL